METLTVNEVAELKGVSRQAIWAAIAAGRIKTVTVKVPCVKIPRDSADAFEPNPKRQAAGRRNKAK